MKLLTGLFRLARKRTQTKDNDMGMFRDKINELVEKKDGLKDEEIIAKVEELKSMAADLPDGDNKAKMERFLEDFKSVKEQDGAAAKEAASMVADLFEKLDTEAMKDTPEVEAPADSAPGETDEEKLAAEANAEDGCGTKDGEDSLVGYMKKPDVPDLKPGQLSTNDEGEEAGGNGNAEYTLEEIYQFIKKRMAEDSAPCAEGEPEEGIKEKEQKEVVTDNAPRIPVTMGASVAPKGSLGEMFNKIKQGGRI